MKLRFRTGVVATSAVVAAALALSGCSSSDSGPSDTGPSNATDGDASQLVEDSADALSEVTGLHLELTTEGTVPNLAVRSLQGDISNDPQTAATGDATLIVGQKDIDAKFVYVDGHLYSDVGDPGGAFTDFGDGASIYDVSTILDPDKGLANVLSKLEDPKIEGTEKIGDTETTKVSGTSSTDDIMALSGSRLAPKDAVEMPTTVWIADDGTNYPVKVQVVPVDGAVLTLSLSEWGKQVDVSKPPV
ncbi:LppX_LprAFG lipoprotein [Mycolicibacillus parakoreensis]|uniref:LppX_LprAFG lipoprotein n=1 Tax=Mycolicibacillus parakoreensis TaxID=1069221 RepID=A0ABY3U101_9MYCO|nr:LppX_LprAFG lipoprotein [Mycolicibacillus parakoreensis]MCV7317353.1 LppX_LprAFG lipoprotein [Mycolicibacillus parakoreensis]ULN51610.1 LppX_LprAFG lipoprotein [Mycolicibacillus parakoreensis]HLR99486.1 LppX_LprAFG lipoprotein [Mycolicibacillus parakoreensis]